jgi:hypothetical protein
MRNSPAPNGAMGSMDAPQNMNRPGTAYAAAFATPPRAGASQSPANGISTANLQQPVNGLAQTGSPAKELVSDDIDWTEFLT